jgi:hypothetical protein
VSRPFRVLELSFVSVDAAAGCFCCHNCKTQFFPPVPLHVGLSGAHFSGMADKDVHDDHDENDEGQVWTNWPSCPRGTA